MTPATLTRLALALFFLSFIQPFSPSALSSPPPAPTLLEALTSPILLRGDAHTAFRDPLLIHNDGTWTPSAANLAEGENACVLVQNNEYVFFYAPADGVGVKRGTDLARLRAEGPPLVFGQADWPWAETRLTAGYVEDLRHVPGVGKYVMVFHGMGPGKTKTDANTNANCSIGIAWSDDLRTWHWPSAESSENLKP